MDDRSLTHLRAAALVLRGGLGHAGVEVLLRRVITGPRDNRAVTRKAPRARKIGHEVRAGRAIEDEGTGRPHGGLSVVSPGVAAQLLWRILRRKVFTNASTIGAAQVGIIVGCCHRALGFDERVQNRRPGNERVGVG